MFRGYTQTIADAPDELSVLGGLLSAPDGSPVTCLAPMWTGEPSQGEEWIARLRQLGAPIMDQVGVMNYRDWFGLFGPVAPAGRHYAAQTRSVARLTPEVIATLVAGGQQKSSPFSGIVLHHFRGAATRIPLAATAFGLRKEHFMVEIVAAWQPAGEDDGHCHRAWARTVSDNLAPHALPGGYPNMLGPDEHQQTAQAFGNNSDRLQKAKQLFDPDGVFTSAISLPPIGPLESKK